MKNPDDRKTGYYRTGIQGIYTVGSSRDYFNLYEDENYIGIKVYNSCGSSILVTKNNKKMETLNTYTKYCPNVFAAKCAEQQEKGNIITMTTKYGQEHEVEVYNYLGRTRDGAYGYSIVRTDGFNAQERAKNKAEKLNGYASNAVKRSNQYYEASNEGRDF